MLKQYQYPLQPRGVIVLFGAMNSPVRPILSEISEFAAMGFDYLELTMDPPCAHYRQIEQSRNELLAALADCGMELVCHLPTFVSLADLNDAIRAASLNEVLRAMEVAATLNPLKIVVHPAAISGMGAYAQQQARDLAFESLDRIVQSAARCLNQPLCLENMFPRTRFGVEPEEFDSILKRHPHIQLTLDVGHAHIGSSNANRILGFIERFADRIKHLHISDNFGKEDQHLPIGTGTIPFPSVAGALKRVGYDATVTLEIFSADRDYLKISRDKFSQLWQNAA